MKSLEEFKKEYILETELGIDASFGRILTIIDFGNVNYWFGEHRIDLNGLHHLTSLFSTETRFYYGHDPDNISFIRLVKRIFRGKVFTKPIQKIRHYVSGEELKSNTRDIFSDTRGRFVYIPKCNFDVEITVDAVRLMEKYDTLALFSSDADFVTLVRYLKGCGKKTILFKEGHVTQELLSSAHKVINAHQIKKYITGPVMQQPGF